MPIHSSFRGAARAAAAFAVSAFAGAVFAAPAQAEQSPYVGEVMFFTNATMLCPAGWELADGRVLNRANHEFLFAVIGKTYGGDGINTFALPDLRGRIVRGVGQGLGLADVALGATGGAEAVQLAPNNIPVAVSPGVKLAAGSAPGMSGAMAQTPSASVPTLAPSLVVTPCVASKGTFPTYP